MPSPYLSRLRTAFQRSVAGDDGAVQGSLKVFVGIGKIFDSSRSFHAGSFSSLADLGALLRPANVVAAASTETQIVERRKNFSFVGAISRTFSTPSVSGPPFNVCAYHIDSVLMNPSQISTGRCKPMAASCSSRILFGECCIGSLTLRRDGASTIQSRSKSCVGSSQRATMSLRNQDQPNNKAIYGYLMFEVGKRWFGSNPLLGSDSRGLHSSSSTHSSLGPARDVAFDSSSREEQQSNSADSADQKVAPGKTLKLVSASCYLPHPDKEETGGEDAHFICVDEQAIGVADGVGGWADCGVDSGLYSRELMSNSVTFIQEEPKGCVDPARVLEKAHSITKSRGSSTACIIALNDQGIHAINLGDSGFMVVREGCTVFRSPVQQHDFNFTYQLESGRDGDLPSSGQVFTVAVAAGDVIIAGTDGLFDNLYNNEITAVVVHAVRAGLGPQATAQKIAALARQRAQDKDRQTPFSTAAQDAGYRYYGGKLDDITVVVSYIAGAGDKK